MNLPTDKPSEEAQFFLYGLTIGKKLGNQINTVFVNLSDDQLERIGSLKFDIQGLSELANIKNYPLRFQLINTMGSRNFGVTANGSLFLASLWTGSRSALSHSITTAPNAKTCYALSVFCSGMAALSSGAAVAARECDISRVGILTEAGAVAFLFAGDRAQKMGEALDRRRGFGFRRGPASGQNYNYFGLYNNRDKTAFVGSPSYNNYSYSQKIEAIPFEQIGRTVGFGLSIYFYVRIGISTYRFGKRLYKKHKIKSSKKLLLKQAKIFTSLVYIRPSLCKRRKLYYFAIS